MRLKANATYSRPGRAAGSSGLWTPPVSSKARAPRAFRSALRAPLHARETLLPHALDAPRASASPSILLRRFNRVSRACGLGRRGYAPRLAAGPWADLWSARAASANRLPPPSIDRARARCDSGGCGQMCPCPTPGRWLGVAPCIARLPPSDCAPMACQRSWHGLLAARARCRGRVAATTGFGAGDAFRHLSPSPIHGDRDPARPARQGLRHFVRSFARSLRAAASAAPWRSGLAAGVYGAPGRRTQEIRR